MKYLLKIKEQCKQSTNLQKKVTNDLVSAQYIFIVQFNNNWLKTSKDNQTYFKRQN